MTLLSEASFLVTPNGYKEDKLYAAIPTNGNGDMTVTRATTATRVNEAGLVELVPYNLFTRSEEFENVIWQKNAGTTVTANYSTAPNGTLTADRYVGVGASGIYQRFSNFTVGQQLTLSIYVKANVSGSSNTFRLYGDSTIVSSNFTATTDWQRFELTITVGLGGANRPYGIIRDSSDNNVDLSIWGAQLVEGTSAKTYQKTVDRLDIPRIDYTGGGCPSILLEPQRTNIVLRSEEFDNASFTPDFSSVSANTTTAPDGTLTADTWTGDGTSGTHRITQTVSTTSGVAYTHSVFAKKGTNSFLQIVGISVSYGFNSYANFDLENGVVGTVGASATATITDFSNGWYRCTMTTTATTTSSYFGFFLMLVTSATSARAETNSLATSVHLWGAQVEEGAYPTSYIPTTTGTVTRLADSCHLLNHSLFTDYPFTVYANAEVDAVGNTIFSLNNTSASSYYLLFYFSSSIQVGILRRDLSNSDSDFYNFSYSAGDTIKVAVAFISPTAYKLYINGTEIADVTSGTSIPFNHNDISLGQFRITGDSGIRNSINEFMVFNEALSDSELQTLTTL